MRGQVNRQVPLLVPAVPIETLIPKDHPIRFVKRLADEALQQLDSHFQALYARCGRPRVAPEQLLKAMVLMALYSIRSERQLCERIQYDLLFRWFLDLQMHVRVFDHSTFSQNRDRLLEYDVAQRFFQAVADHGRELLMSPEHFTVDGTLIQAWASTKSFRPKGEKPEERPQQDDAPKNPTVDFRGEKRSNPTHQSSTDPEARLARKSSGEGAKLCFQWSVLMENRCGLLVDMELTQATGTAEREAALAMLKRNKSKSRRISLGADKGYDCQQLVEQLRQHNVTPHIAAKEKGSAIDARTQRGRIGCVADLSALTPTPLPEGEGNNSGSTLPASRRPASAAPAAVTRTARLF